MAEVQAFIRLLPKDDLKLSIVDSKPLALANGVSKNDDFFVHTPRKTIAEVLESKQVEKCIMNTMFLHAITIVPNARITAPNYCQGTSCIWLFLTIPMTASFSSLIIWHCNCCTNHVLSSLVLLLMRFRILMCCPPF
ncbi:unnamed protein product [Brassica oleracea var. botrytis]